ncbi:MAG: DUF1835 domain-containing protein [Acidobacteria bacterium]|nr:DUF1835 domain-containing protein [Acidobacteriota bacterium]
MVHITNGDAVAALLRRWAGEPRLIVWRDILHEGEVLPGLTLEQQSVNRAAFLEVPVKDFEARDRQMRLLAQRDSVWLWFEDDLYDQLQLLQILDFLHTENITTAFYIDIPRTLTLDQMASLAANKKPLKAQAFALAAAAWKAFTEGTAESLLEDDLSALPHLRVAIERLLEHYPDERGFNRIERTILDLLPDSAANLFARYQATEARPFLGDTTFFAYLRGLAPIVESDRRGIYARTVVTERPPRERWVGGRRFQK